MQANNLYSNIPESIPEELTDILMKQQNIRIERIISQGQTSPSEGWYDQEEHEWVVLLQGEAKISFEDGSYNNLTKGSYLQIPPKKKHKVSYTSSNPKCIWLAIFY